MPFAFQAIRSPSVALMTMLGELTEDSPFHSPAFVQAAARAGRTPWLLGLWDAERLVTGALGLVRGPWMLRRMEIVTAPRVQAADGYWSGVLSFCVRHGIAELVVNTWAGLPGTVPDLPGQRHRRGRTEYVLDLRQDLDPHSLSVNHRRNIARARRAGLRVQRTYRPEAARTLVRLHHSSMERRRQRVGMPATVGTARQARQLEALLGARAGEVFEAVDGSSVVAAALFLRSDRQAYYQFSGTSSQGREQGAAALLVWEAAARLKADGLTRLNLGGADEDGLRRFKSGFGTQEIPLEAATFAVSSGGLHALFRAAARMREALVRRAPALRK